MKKIILSGLIALTMAISCKKAEYMSYHSSDNVVFDFSDTASDKDSIVFTFAYTPGKATDTIQIPVSISGERVPYDRKFKIAVTDSGTTAQAGLHYEPFKEDYTMPADNGFVHVPLVIYNKDSLLIKRSVSINFHLVATDALGTQIADLDSGRVVFSNKLERPAWWNMWLGSYYSQVKHKLFLLATGVTSLSQTGLDAPKNLYYVGLLNSFLTDPFTWLNKNPGKGYVMDPQPDGSYYFYNAENPADKILYQKDDAAGRYFFIDENGQEVI